eukprot:10089185-Alexandrium_andersonii.AAC.1
MMSSKGTSPVTARFKTALMESGRSVDDVVEPAQKQSQRTARPEPRLPGENSRLPSSHIRRM